MDRLTGIEVFVEVAEQGSFSGAARRLGLSSSAVGKHVAALEERLGARLFNRTTRRVSLTEAGARFYEHAGRLLAELAEAEVAVGELHAEPRGTLRVNGPMSFGIRHLGDAVADFIRLHPKIRIELSLTDRFVDVVDEGWDIAIRIGDLDSSSLIARRLAPCRRLAVAAPAYLAAHGPPGRPEDLARHACLLYGHDPGVDDWVLEQGGERVRVRVDGPLRSNNGDAIKAAALAGLGVALTPTFICSEELADGRLVPALPGWWQPDIPVAAVYPPNRRVSRKVRTFIDFLADRYGPRPEWDCRIAHLLPDG